MSLKIPASCMSGGGWLELLDSGYTLKRHGLITGDSCICFKVVPLCN